MKLEDTKMLGADASRSGVPAALLDGAGLLALAAAVLFLGAAYYTDDPMAMGVYMGLFIASVIGAILLFASSRFGGCAPARMATPLGEE